MKKLIAILLSLCLCFGMCACSAEPEVPQGEVIPLEELIDFSLIGAHSTEADKRFGQPHYIYTQYYDGSRTYDNHWDYDSVVICGLSFTPRVGVKSETMEFLPAGPVGTIAGYLYLHEVEKKTEQHDAVVEELRNYFTQEYGEPYFVNKGEYKWKAEDSRGAIWQVELINSSTSKGTHRIIVKIVDF